MRVPCEKNGFRRSALCAAGSPVVEKATTPALLDASRSAVRTAPLADLQAIGVSGLQITALAGIERLKK
jgi:hypothetical protein